jgi:hypothetical protein
MLDEPSRTRTGGDQTDLEVCGWCHELFPPANAKRLHKKRFCSPKCRAAYSREVGMVVTLKSARRLKTVKSLVIHSSDDRVLQYPIGKKFRLVPEPEDT